MLTFLTLAFLIVWFMLIVYLLADGLAFIFRKYVFASVPTKVPTKRKVKLNTTERRKNKK